MLEVRSTTNSGSSGSAVYESARAVDEYLQVTYKQDPLMFSSIDIERVLAYAASTTALVPAPVSTLVLPLRLCC